MTKLRPQGNRVLIRPAKAPTSKGGILLPESSQETPKQGEVLEVGPGKLKEDGSRSPMSLKKGDQVVYSNYAGTEVSLNDEELLIMSEEDIYGVCLEV